MMTTDDWKTLESAFGEAIELAGSDRDDYLAGFADRHPQLAERLQDLLAADEADDQSIEAPISATAAALSDRTDDPWLDRQIGAWRVVRRIGDGGMGAVFLAERSDEVYEQSAALKIMTSQLLSGDGAQRFRAERQILASLQHPNIASLIDGGATDEGLPFLVMEYVDGLPIDRYCEENALNLRQRLRLFQQVCAAVDYAHRNLVVHRDLKPSNILVDSNGAAMLLDFGIAKLLDAGSYNLTQAMTREGARAMTPSYASPEHVRGQPVSIASDVYSLGVLLYRLLTGRSPYQGSLDSQHSIEEAILKSDPQRPSTAVTQADPTQATAESASLGDPERLRRLLSGDLDNIVLKSLQKDPERRYRTAAEFSADIANYLENRPVAARADSFGYRAGKFLRRNRAAVSGVALFVATIAALTTFYTVQLARERDLARLEADRAEQVAGFLTDLFEAANPSRNFGEPMDAGELLDLGAQRIADSLGDQPELQAALLLTVGESYRKMRENAEARDFIQSVLPDVQASLGENHSTVLRLRHVLAGALTTVGEFDEGANMLREDQPKVEATFGPESLDAAKGIRLLGVNRADVNETEEAEALFDRAISLFRGLGVEGSDDLSLALMEQGALMRAIGRPEDELPLLREALTIQESVGGSESFHYAAIVNNLGNNHYVRGEVNRARELYEEHLRLQRRLAGGDSVPVANALGNLANVVSDQGEPGVALEMLEEALAIYGRGYGEDSFLYGFMQESIANTHMRLQNYELADTYYQGALQRIGAHFGTDHQEYAFTQASYATFLLRIDRVDESVEQLRQAYATNLATRGETHGRTLETGYKLADALVFQQNPAEALPLAEAVAAVVRTPPVEATTRTVDAIKILGKVHAALSDFENSDAAYAEARELAGQLESRSRHFTYQIDRLVAETLIVRERYGEARALLEPQIEAIEASGSDEEGDAERARALLARIPTSN